MSITQNSYLNQYLDQCMQLVKTLVVKFDEAPLLMNEAVAKTYGSGAVDPSLPETWKYYMNLSGQYHPTDRIMTVVSIDNLEEIEFTRENLEIHTATRDAHVMGSPAYQRLLLRYPDQKSVIDGILTPVDIDLAIEAESGTILGYPDHLVESNESSLIPDLEKHIKQQIARWHNVQFAMSDSEYCTTFWTVLMTQLFPVLLNLRTARCKTPEAHSFHVRMYLGSHGELDRFLPYLTLKQALWLYRNIVYLEHNHGKSSQFKKLIQHLLTDRGIPIGSYSVRHTDDFTVDYIPEQIAFLNPLNHHMVVDLEDRHSVDVLLRKEIPESPGNNLYYEQYGTAMDKSFRLSRSAEVQTKVLDSSMVDYSNAVPETFEMVAIREWFHLSQRGYYDVVINFKDPGTGEPRTLFAHDAFLYMQYLVLKAEGFDIQEVPQYINMQQRILPKPTVEDLLSVVDTTKHNLRRHAEEIVRRQPDIGPVMSVSAFHVLARKLTEECLFHWYLISSMGDHYERAMVENMVRRLYEDVRQDYDTQTLSMDTWLRSKDLPPYAYSYEEALQLAKTIYEASTGLEVGSVLTLKNIQAAMIAITKQLSSYTIQFTSSIIDDDIVLINWPAIRLGNLSTYGETTRSMDVNVFVLDSSGSGATPKAIALDVGVKGGGSLTGSTEQDAEIELVGAVAARSTSESTTNITFRPYSLDITYDGQDEALDNKHLLPGYTTFHNLPESSRSRLKSRYSQSVI